MSLVRLDLLLYVPLSITLHFPLSQDSSHCFEIVDVFICL